MNFIVWIVVGLVAGVIAKLLLPGRDPGGCIITILIGIAGAFLGGFLFRTFGYDAGVGFWPNVGVAIIGSIVLLLLYRLVGGKRR